MAEAAVDRVEVKIVPCLTGTSDNYSYLIIDKDTRQAAAVDPHSSTYTCCPHISDPPRQCDSCGVDGGCSLA
eukprot:m.91440 g.91440  ORF g.91440 m.91440 type:complete len:72 (-) comp15038_c0_seq2:52-267(-)